MMPSYTGFTVEQSIDIEKEKRAVGGFGNKSIALKNAAGSWNIPPQFKMDRYPTFPGWKKGLPSLEAAVKMAPKAQTLRDKVYAALKAKPMTADETALALDEDRLAIRPRLSELKKLNLIEDSGERRLNQSKCRATVWQVKGVNQ